MNPSPAAASAGNSRAGSRSIAGQVADGVVVLHVRQPAHDDRPGIARVRRSLGVEARGHPAAKLRSLLPADGCGLSFGRHLAAVQRLGDLLPDLGIAPEVGHRLIRLEVEVSLVLLRRVAAQAELLDDGLNLAVVVPAEGLERRRLCAMGRGQKGKAAERRDQTSRVSRYEHQSLTVGWLAGPVKVVSTAGGFTGSSRQNVRRTQVHTFLTMFELAGKSQGHWWGGSSPGHWGPPARDAVRITLELNEPGKVLEGKHIQ